MTEIIESYLAKDKEKEARVHKLLMIGSLDLVKKLMTDLCAHAHDDREGEFQFLATSYRLVNPGSRYLKKLNRHLGFQDLMHAFVLVLSKECLSYLDEFITWGKQLSHVPLIVFLIGEESGQLKKQVQQRIGKRSFFYIYDEVAQSAKSFIWECSKDICLRQTLYSRGF
jgi:hypothetical protein